MGRRDSSVRGTRRRAALLVGAAALALFAVTGVAWAIKGEPSFQERVPAFDIGGATGLTAAPGGDHLYASGGDSLTVLSRDAATGDFDYVETETDGVDDPSDPGGQVDGLDSATGVAISPDGAHVYATGWQPDDSIAVFSRDATTGRLSFVEVESDGVNDPGDAGGAVDFLFRPEGVAVSGDGGSVYAVSSSDDSVVAFDRDPGSGELSYLGADVDGIGGVDGMQGPSGVAAAPDGEAIYVTTNSDDSLVAFSRNTGTGELTYVEFEDDGVDDAGDAGGVVNGLNGATAVVVSPDDDVVYASGQIDSAVAAFERDTASEELSFIEAEVNGVDDAGDAGGAVSGLISPRGIATDADGDNLYATGSSSDSVVVFRFNPATDELVFIESESEGVDPGDGGATPDGLSQARAVVAPPDGAHVYVAGLAESGLAAFARSSPATPTFGRLGFLFAKPNLTLDTPRGVAVSPDGEHVVLTTLGDSSMRSFSRDPATGVGELLDTETEGVDDPSDTGPAAEGIYEPAAVTFSPDGAHVYVTDTSFYAISLYRFNAATGELTFVESEQDGIDDLSDPGGTVTGLYEPWDVVVSPDGASVYGLANSDDGLAAFERDPATGRLSFAEAEFDGVDDAGDAGATVDGLAGAESIAISPDGEHLYAAGIGDDAVAVFARDAATSEVSFLEVERDGVNDAGDAGGTVDGLDAPADVAVSNDGGQLYAAADDALLRFSRNAATGRLSFAEVEKEGVNDPSDAGGVVAGLSSATALAISADGDEVYVTADGTRGTLATFSRDPSTGALSFFDLETDRVNDPGDAGGVVAGLEGVEDIAVAPDDRHLYLADEQANSLTIFDREDDFAPPETTITSGPGEGEATNDNTPSFGYSSSEPGSTFACSVDGGAEQPCPESLATLADGPHSLSVAATDTEGNTDATPAIRGFTVDTALAGAKVKAKRKQKQKGKKIKVKLELSAGEAATGTGSGKIVVGKRSYKLKELSKDLAAGAGKTLKLKPKKSKHKAKIAKALRKGKKVKAKLTGEVSDPAGNELVKDKTVTLKR